MFIILQFKKKKRQLKQEKELGQRPKVRPVTLRLALTSRSVGYNEHLLIAIL